MTAWSSAAPIGAAMTSAIANAAIGANVREWKQGIRIQVCSMFRMKYRWL